jgi:hypothetical protein
MQSIKMISILREIDATYVIQPNIKGDVMCHNKNNMHLKTFEQITPTILEYYYYIKNCDYRLILEIIKQKKELKCLNGHSNALKIEAIKKNWRVIIHIKNPTNEMKMLAIQLDPLALERIKKPTDEMIFESIKNCGCMIKHVIDPTEEMILAAINSKEYGYGLNLLKNPSKELILSALKKYGYMIEHVIDPTEEMKMLAIKSCGIAIKFINDPSEELKIAAIMQNPYSLKYINNPSEYLRILAIKQNVIKPWNYRRMDNYTYNENVDIEFVKQNGLNLKDIRDQTDNVVKEAIKQNGFAIGMVNKKPSVELELLAVVQNPLSIHVIIEPSSEAIALAMKSELVYHIDTSKKDIELMIKEKIKNSYIHFVNPKPFESVRYEKNELINYRDLRKALLKAAAHDVNEYNNWKKLSKISLTFRINEDENIIEFIQNIPKTKRVISCDYDSNYAVNINDLEGEITKKIIVICQ